MYVTTKMILLLLFGRLAREDLVRPHYHYG